MSPDGTGVGPVMEQLPKSGRDARNEAFLSVIFSALDAEDLQDLVWPQWEAPYE